MNGLGFEDIFLLDEAETRARVDSPLHLGALWEPRLVLVHPLKLVRAEAGLARREGAEVYENTPVEGIERNGAFRLRTPRGTRHGRAAGAGHQRLFAPLPLAEAQAGARLHPHAVRPSP